MNEDFNNKAVSEEGPADRIEVPIEAVATETEMSAKSEAIETVTKSRQDDELLSILKDNRSLLYEIKETIQNRLEYDAVKEKAFDKLYEEMRRQKEGAELLDRAVKPVLSDLLLLYDSAKKFECSLTNNQRFNNEDALLKFKYILEELTEVLYRQEVIPIEENLTGTFNSKIHKATMTEKAESIADDFKITAIVRSGFTWREKVLRPQEVIIKRFTNNVD